MIHPDYKQYAEFVKTMHQSNTNNPIDFPMNISKLKQMTGNLIDLAEAETFDVIVQGCNCFNTMGGGIAREIRARYPDAARADNTTIRGDYDKLGTWTAIHTGKFIIINAYTQFNMSNGEDVFEYAAFELILKKLHYTFPRSSVGFPAIGMGLAGGDSTRILPMLEEFARKQEITGGSATLVTFG